MMIVRMMVMMMMMMMTLMMIIMKFKMNSWVVFFVFFLPSLTAFFP